MRGMPVPDVIEAAALERVAVVARAASFIDAAVFGEIGLDEALGFDGALTGFFEVAFGWVVGVSIGMLVVDMYRGLRTFSPVWEELGLAVKGGKIGFPLAWKYIPEATREAEIGFGRL